MRYVIVDLDGASRDYFSSRGAVREALREAERDTPGIAAELYVIRYDGEGKRFGDPERGDELLRVPGGVVAVLLGQPPRSVVTQTTAPALVKSSIGVQRVNEGGTLPAVPA